MTSNPMTGSLLRRSDDILTGMGAEQFEHGVGIELKFMVELIEYGKRVRRREVIGVFEQQGAGLGKKSFKQGTLLLQKFPYLGWSGPRESSAVRR